MKCGLAWVTKRLKLAVPRLKMFDGRQLCRDDVKALCGICLTVCKPKAERLTWEMSTALFNSLSHLIGQPADPAMLKANVHRVIANWTYIEMGAAVPQWKGELIPGDIVIMGIGKPFDFRGKMAFIAKVKVRTGLAAGLIADLFMTDSQAYMFLDHIGGVAKFKLPFEEISGMSARVTMTMERNRLRIDQWDCPSSAQEANKALATARSMPDKCTNPVPCNTCNRNNKECPLAVWLEGGKDKKDGSDDKRDGRAGAEAPLGEGQGEGRT